MKSTTVAVIMAFASATMASPTHFRRDACQDADTACRNAPDANFSTCASNLVACQLAAGGSALLPLGATCVAGKDICANGASCYSTNSGLVTRCGNFQAACSSDSQCAYNTCTSNGLCGGFLPSSAYLANSATPTATATASATAPLTTSTATGLPLGALCDPSIANQCANGVDCWASTSGLVRRCGNFQASCASDSQCAYNTCNNGLCNGFLASSLYLAQPLTTTTAPTSATPATTAPAFSSISGIPGGCNPAHPGSCPTTTTAAAAPAATGAGWTVENLIRYCSAAGTGCDYNFDVDNGAGATEHCTVSTTNSSIDESWYDKVCNTGSNYRVSWGYSDQFGVDNAFAVLTVVNVADKTRAFFGIADVNDQPVSASSPKGSGHYGNIGPQVVESYA